jgi:mannosylglycerate hydrolase
MSSKKVHVVSNTHWDREHRHGFQETRFMLVETVDRLIEIMENDPDFKYFTFDGQSVWVDDYLEVRPQMRERLKALVEAGRIQIGPWYSLPDHFSCHPEAVVRNLLMGNRVCEKMGGVTKFGYSIFSFSQIAQLPQIYSGFGVENVMFYKLYPIETLKKSEFWWTSPDGTRALCSRLGPLARANFYFSFTIPVILGGNALSKEEGSWQVRFTDGAKICRLIDDGFDHPHATELEQDIRIRKEALHQAIEKTVDSASCESFNHKVLLGFDGNDFTMPLAELPAALRMANDAQGEVTFVHSTPLNYFAEFRETTDLSLLPVVGGEMRFGPLCRVHCELMGTAIEIMHRMAKAESLLIHTAEPFAAFGAMGGAAYPRDVLRLAWKYLMQCHAHDSTHGIGVPKIVPDVLSRLDQVQEMAEGIANRAIQGLVRQIDTSNADNGDVFITVFNPTATIRSEVTRLLVELPRGEKICDWWLEEMDGTRVEFYSYTETPHNLASVNHENRPKALYIKRVDLDAELSNIPAYGYKTFRLARKIDEDYLDIFPFPNPKDPYRPLGSMPNGLENEFLKVTIQPNGTVDVTDKETGRTTRGLNLILNSGDAGDMWIHRKPKVNKIISNLGAQADIQLMRNSSLLASFRVEVVLNIPESLTQDRLARSEHTVPVKFATDITLRKGSRRLDFKLHFNNVCKDHMLTVRFPSCLQTEALVSDVAFEVRERPVENMTDKHGVRGDELRRQPKFRFVDISDGKSGLAVFGKGQNEYEPHQFDDGAGIEMTLMRSMTQTFPVHWDVFFSYEKEASQSLGEHTFEYALYFHDGDYKVGRVQVAAQHYITPVVAAQYGKGRVAGTLPLEEGSFLTVSCPLTNVSAVKLAEDRDDALTVRVNNPTDEVIQETLTFLRPIKKAWLCNLNEESEKELPIIGKSVSVRLDPYKIVTVMVEF